MIGTRIGPYLIVAEIEVGGQGMVYRATHERLHTDVALKFLPPELVANESARRRFEREAIALSRVNHPSVPTARDFQTVDGRDFLVMEYIPGESLNRRIARGAIPEPELIALGIQLAEGLAEAHRQGVIHRDLKPGNLRVTPEGRLKILDFGLAHYAGSDAATTTGIAGTPAYLAPEVVAGEHASPRSDVYSAGVVLYQAATGSLPFPELKTGALLEAIARREPPAPRTRNPAISASLEAVILRCMAKAPHRRYATAEELAADLKHMQEGGAVRPPARPQRRSLVGSLALVLVAAAIAGVLWVYFRPIPPPGASRIRSLAVLPLGNLTGDPAQEYVADGMTEELIAQLSSLDSLRVTSLTSAMRFKNARATMPEVARTLGVDGVVEGSVSRADDKMKIVVRLVAAREDEQLWNGQYEGSAANVPGLQGRVAKAIMREVRLNLTKEERSRLKARQHVDPVAYQLYLHGRSQWNSRTDDGIRRSIDYFERAIRQDSTYALFHAGLADAWAAAGLYGLTPPLEARERARAAARKAVALDPELSEAHTSLAHVLHNFDWDWRAAEQEYLRAIELGPNNPIPHHWLGHLLAQQGRFDEAREELRLAEEIDPLSYTIAMAGGVNEYYARRYDAALAHIRHAETLDTTSSLVHRTRAGVLDRLGREREAANELALSFERKGQRDVAFAVRGAYARGGLDAVLELLIGGLLKKRASGAYEPAEHVAELYARLGRIDDAFHWLDVALAEHDTELNRLLVDPLFDPLRKDPRFERLLRSVGLLEPRSRS